jgi:SAM-dependent methyltransferase
VRAIADRRSAGLEERGLSDLPLLFSDVARWYAASTVALGIRTGLVDALLADGGSAGELAAAAGVDEDNAARWADAMVAGGYATVSDARYAPVEDAMGLLRGGTMLDVGAIVELLVPLGALLPRVATAIQDGGGIRSDEFQAALGMTAERVNVPMYERLLLSEWIAGNPDLQAALDRGVDAAEVGPGGGTALRILARQFPASRFVGFDIDAATVTEANEKVTAEGLANLRFEAMDASALPEQAFDIVCLFDAFHHMTDPGGVLDGIRASLRPGGSLLLAEAAVSGDAAADAADPTAVLIYGSDLIYCYQESKLPGRPGLGATWPGRGLAALLAGHGFEEVERVESQAGYLVLRAVPSR